MNLQRKKYQHARLAEALALLHKPPQLTDAERAQIEHDLAKPRGEKQPELPLDGEQVRGQQ